MATSVYGNDIDTPKGDIKGSTMHVQTMFPLKDWKKRKVFEDIFLFLRR